MTVVVMVIRQPLLSQDNLFLLEEAVASTAAEEHVIKSVELTNVMNMRSLASTEEKEGETELLLSSAMVRVSSYNSI